MRYAVIKTQKKPQDGVHNGPSHWLVRGTLVRILAETDQEALVETLYPVFGVSVMGDTPNSYAVKEQHILTQDYLEIPGQFGPLLEAWAEYFQSVREWLCLA